MLSKLILVLSILSLAACSTFEGVPAPVIDPDADIAALSSSISSAAVAQCISGLGVSDAGISPQAGSTAIVQVPRAPETPEACRNRIVHARRYVIDLRFSQFEADFFARNRWAGLGTTVAALGLSTAASLSPTGVAQALSAAASGVTGTRAAYNEEILAKQTLPALLSTMHAQRDLIWVSIRDGLSRNATDYPLGAALSDLQAYYRAGTIVGALTTVTQTSAAQASAAEEALRNPLPPTRTDAAQYLQSLIETGLEPSRAENRDRIRAQMRQLRISDRITVSRFVRFGDKTEIETVARNLGWTGAAVEASPVPADRGAAGTSVPARQEPRPVVRVPIAAPTRMDAAQFLRSLIETGPEQSRAQSRARIRAGMQRFGLSERMSVSRFVRFGDPAQIEAVARDLRAEPGQGQTSPAPGCDAAKEGGARAFLAQLLQREPGQKEAIRLEMTKAGESTQSTVEAFVAIGSNACGRTQAVARNLGWAP